MGQEVIDGKLAFIVNEVDRSPTFNQTRARGEWLIVSMAVRNIGTAPQPFDMAAESLKESDGRGHSASLVDPPTENKIDPGLQVSVRLAFDAPPGVHPTQIVLRESASSPGVKVNLRPPRSSPPAQPR